MVRVERGFARLVQVLWSHGTDLSGISGFLHRVFGVSVSPSDLALSSFPKPSANRLKSLSWELVRRARADWVAVTRFGGWVSEKVSEKLEGLGPGSWVEIVSAPRVGKSSGALLGLMKWVVESGVDGYVVLVVVPNKKVGRQLYRYLLGSWKRFLGALRLEGWNAGMLTKCVRVRYYEGAGGGCLLGRVHRVEDCLACPLFKAYHREWRGIDKLPVPVLDPVILKLSGYCPFHALFSPVFWRNSFVVISWRLLPLVPHILSRLRVRRVVVYLDEYLFHLSRRLRLAGVDPGKLRDQLKLEVDWRGRRISFGEVLHRYNSVLEELVGRVFEEYERVGAESLGSTGLTSHGVLLYALRVIKGEVDLSGVARWLEGEVGWVVGVLEEFYRRYRLPVFRRMRRVLEFWYLSLYRCEWYGDGFRRVFAPEVVGGGVASAFGGWVRAFVDLVSRGREVYVVSSSVDDSNFYLERDLASSASLRVVAPGEAGYARLSVVYRRGVVGFVSPPFKKDREGLFYAGSLRELFDMVRGGRRNVCVVVDKESMLRLAKAFEKLGWRVLYGGEDGVIDYVVVERPNGTMIFLLHSHGRSSMGIDPPLRDEIETVVVALGVRGYPRLCVPVPSVFRGVVRDGMVISGAEGVGGLGVPGTYAVVQGGLMWVYDVFQVKYDVHLLVQVIGRFFLSRSMKYVVLNPRFMLGDLKFFFVVDGQRDLGAVGRVYKVKWVGEDGREYSEFEVYRQQIGWWEIRPVAEEVRITWFVEGGDVGVDYRKFMRSMYNRLRNVYGSLRYCRRQLRYGNQPNKWWLAEKLLYLASGFEYARLEGAPVPHGLKRMFRVYASEGLRGLLAFVRGRYLSNLDPETWDFIRRRLRLLWT